MDNINASDWYKSPMFWIVIVIVIIVVILLVNSTKNKKGDTGTGKGSLTKGGGNTPTAMAANGTLRNTLPTRTAL